MGGFFKQKNYHMAIYNQNHSKPSYGIDVAKPVSRHHCSLKKLIMSYYEALLSALNLLN